MERQRNTRHVAEWHLRGRPKTRGEYVGKEEEQEGYILPVSEVHDIPNVYVEREGWSKSKTGSRAFMRDVLCCIPPRFFSSCFGVHYSYPALNYESFLSQVKTGDIFLFEGKGSYSWAIQCFTRMRYSHIGVAIKMLDPKDSSKPHFMLWESTRPDGAYDFITGTEKKDGLRLVSMHEKLYGYAHRNYSISYRPITVMSEKVRKRISTGEAGRKAWELILRGARIPYETDYVELLNSHKRWVIGQSGNPGEDEKSLDAVFCSEALAWFFRDAMGLSLQDEQEGITWEPRDFTPEDFAEETEGIPFVYSDPPLASFGGQYIVASRESVDKGLTQRYMAYLKSQPKLGNRFHAMVDGARTMTEIIEGGSQTIHIDGRKLWDIDFGYNKYPVIDEKGMQNVILDEYT